MLSMISNARQPFIIKSYARNFLSAPKKNLSPINTISRPLSSLTSSNKSTALHEAHFKHQVLFDNRKRHFNTSSIIDLVSSGIEPQTLVSFFSAASLGVIVTLTAQGLSGVVRYRKEYPTNKGSVLYAYDETKDYDSCPKTKEIRESFHSLQLEKARSQIIDYLNQ
ncbi:hypothetical protein HOG98_10165 [bacterium]|jgi:hypothetical protein|nr:hypothetical protein [bacterium]